MKKLIMALYKVDFVRDQYDWKWKLPDKVYINIIIRIKKKWKVCLKVKSWQMGPHTAFPLFCKGSLVSKEKRKSTAFSVKWREGTEGRVEALLNPFLIKVLYEEGWSAPQYGRCTLLKETRSPATYCTGNWVGPSVCLDGFGEQKISFTHQVSNPESSSPYQVPIPATLFRY